jgi:hypothetical protein
MQFTKRLREPIKRGEITTSLRIWRNPRNPGTHSVRLPRILGPFSPFQAAMQSND